MDPGKPAGSHALISGLAKLQRSSVLHVGKSSHRAPLENPVAEKEATWEAALMADLFSRITTKPGQCGGRPCVRGMRIRVTDVLDLLVSGLTPAEILNEMPDLEADDIRACVAYANS
jgi:uncharacterized protein (DUF433 family)